MLKLHDILRAGTVKRFHLVNTTRVQTLAEHQYGVAILATEIANRAGWPHDKVAAVAYMALVHDADESRTGDIPTPTKKRMRAKFGAAFDDVLGEFDPLRGESLSAGVAVILKCADYLESILFLGEHRVGRHAEFVYDDIYADAMDYFNCNRDFGSIAIQVLSELENAVYEI